MPTPTFAPGWRFSALDGVVLVVGLVATVAFAFLYWPIGFVIGFTLAHFFLFCNVVRLSRVLEAVWGTVFVVFCLPTILYEQPGWAWTVALSLGVTVVVVAIELRKPSYHGVGWRVINPRLQTWWDAQLHEVRR